MDIDVIEDSIRNEVIRDCFSEAEYPDKQTMLE